MKKPLVILTGPTAVGKTSISIALAKAINGAIISADSMQVYRHMDIGTAKITKEEMDGIEHYLVDMLEPTEDFNVTEFQKHAKEAMEEIYRNGKIPIIVGGTGFYIQSVLYDVDFTQTDTDTSYRDELYQLAAKYNNEYVHGLLMEVDPKSARTIHPNNLKRVIRALEYYHQTKEEISSHNIEQKSKESPYNYGYFVLTDDRMALYERINYRVDLMLEQGLVDEVKHLYDLGLHEGMTSMKGIGYKEILRYLNNEYTLEEAIYVLKRDTRHFAKRQLTWFKREKEVVWLSRNELGNLAQIVKKIITILEEKRIL